MRKFIKKLLLYLKYHDKKIRIGRNCNIGINSSFEGMNVIHDDVSFDGFIGYGSYIGEKSIVMGKIGRFCSIASNVIVAEGIHPTDTFVSTHPTFFSVLKQNGETFVTEQKFIEHKYADLSGNCIIVGNDVWIGTNVTILSGISIGDGAIVAAGSVLTKNVEPYSIVTGVPAKIIRYRFCEKHINYLLEYQWWNKSIDWIRKNADIFSDVNKLIEYNNRNL